jgi:hypothetical protein
LVVKVDAKTGEARVAEAGPGYTRTYQARDGKQFEVEPRRVKPLTDRTVAQAEAKPFTPTAPSSTRPGFVPEMTEAEVGELGAKVPFEGIGAVSRDIFAGRAPDVATWNRLRKAPDGFQLEYERFNVDRFNHFIEVESKLKTSDEKPVGELRTVFRRDGDELVAMQTLIKLGKEYQASGIGFALIKNAITELKAIGVSRIEMDAAWIGRYAWAKLGFTYPDAAIPFQQEQLTKFLISKGVDPDKAAKMALSAKDGAPAIARLVDKNGRKWGKEYFLDKSTADWMGGLSLQDGDPGFEIAKKVLGLN